MSKMYTLMNAKKQNEEHPTTFEIPSEIEIESIKNGDHVKLCFEEEEDKLSERMWVEVTEIGDGVFTGALDNEPYGLENIKYRDVVTFKTENILSVL